MVSPQIAEEFQKIMLEEYGQEISLDDAASVMTDLVGYFDLLAKIAYREATEDHE